jgi:hypothetical protein
VANYIVHRANYIRLADLDMFLIRHVGTPEPGTAASTTA